MGLTEIILVAVVAIIFLGPDKLPQALIDIAKLFKAFKKTINDAKESLDREININEIKQEALAYKKQLEDSTTDIPKSFKLESLESLMDEPAKPKTQEQSTAPLGTVETKPEESQNQSKELEFKRREYV